MRKAGESGIRCSNSSRRKRQRRSRPDGRPSRIYQAHTLARAQSGRQACRQQGTDRHADRNARTQSHMRAHKRKHDARARAPNPSHLAVRLALLAASPHLMPKRSCLTRLCTRFGPSSSGLEYKAFAGFDTTQSCGNATQQSGLGLSKQNGRGGEVVLYRHYIGMRTDMSVARVWMCRCSK